MSGRIGEGVVIARLPEGGWSGPSAIGTGGAGFGFQVGGQVTEFVIILNTQEIGTCWRTFSPWRIQADGL